MQSGMVAQRGMENFELTVTRSCDTKYKLDLNYFDMLENSNRDCKGISQIKED